MRARCGRPLCAALAVAGGLLSSVLGCVDSLVESPGVPGLDAAAEDAALGPGEGALCRAEPWAAADRLFRGDPHWHGGDAAYSVPLGGERTLWLFADSFVSRAPSASRQSSVMVRNSVAIMHGRDPSRAALRFYFGERPDGTLAPFFDRAAPEWYWPAHGARLGAELLLFLYRMEPDAGAAAEQLRFRYAGTEAVRVKNPDAEPDAWQLEPMPIEAAPAGLALGASLLPMRDALYAYAVEPDPPHRVSLLRWPLSALYADSLPMPETWTGRAFGDGPPAFVVPDAAYEISVHRERESGRFVVAYSDGYGEVPIVLRFADAPEGPFGPAFVVYRPRVKPGQIAYAGKAHPELRGADLVLTYAVNGGALEAVKRDETIYYPRFVKLDRGRCPIDP